MFRLPILPAIVTGNCNGLVCIQDSLEQSGRHLLHAFGQNAICEKCDVHFICNESPAMKLQHHLQINESATVHFHDSFNDPLGWMKGSNTEDVIDNSTSEMSITEILENGISRKRRPYFIILESLSAYVLKFGFPTCYHEFNKLLTSGVNGLKVSGIVCRVHEDTLPSADIYLPQLTHLSTIYITVKPPPSAEDYPIAYIIHKRPGGKVIKQIEEYIVNENGIKAQMMTERRLNAQKSRENANDILNDLTTFKLSLGQREKEARDQLVLPYIRKEKNSKEEEEEAGAKDGGKVYYEPDAADDWDEDDPDDDLDI